MSNEGVEVHALSLFSGGLDSQLAVSLLREQGLRIHAVTFTNPFLDGRAAAAAALRLGVPHESVELTAPLVAVLSRTVREKYEPAAPCAAYHKEMLSRAREIMEDRNFDFLFTGDVLDQHPATQAAEVFARIDRESGCGQRVLRPLSAGLLPPTVPERKGLVARNRLGSLRGPSRRAQVEMAARYDIRDYAPPCAACCITDEVFTRRVRDLCKHEGFNGARSLLLLRLGRHFRLGPAVKLVVGRNEHENARLEGLADLYDLLLKPAAARGPSALLPYTATDEDIETAAAICARYSDVEANGSLRVRVRSPRETREVTVRPLSPEEADRLRVHAARSSS